MTGQPTPQLLLSHAGFLRALARDLVRDENAADDLVQRTWLAALKRPPRRAGALRSWLGRVARNDAWRERRDEARRAGKHAHIERGAAPSAAELAERQELLRGVADAVLALPEPYRSAIHLRYYEGLTPGQIARREGRPPNTVKAQLNRGLARLREELDRRNGGRREWCLALALCVPGGTSALWPALVAALVVAGGVVLLNLLPGGQPPADALPLQASIPATPPRAPAEATLRRENPPPGAEDHYLRGRVVDEQGQALQSVELKIFHSPHPKKKEGPGDEAVATLHTDTQGRYALEFAGPRTFIVLLMDDRYRKVEGPGERLESPADGIDFVVARQPAAHLTIRVRDLSTGKYIESFAVSIAVPNLEWMASNKGSWAGGASTSRAHGGVAEHWIALPGPDEPCRVELSTFPGGQRTLHLRSGERLEVEITCRSGPLIHGVVVDPLGAPIAGAIVHDGRGTATRGDEPFKPFREERLKWLTTTRTDEQGGFALAADHHHLTVWHADHSPRTVCLPDALRIVLQPRGAICGRLLDAAGEPRADVRVVLDRSLTARTDAQGRFAFEKLEAGVRGIHLPEGERIHKLSFAGGGPWAVRVPPGETVEVELTPGLPELSLELRTGGKPFAGQVRGLLLGLDSPGSFADLRGSGPTLTARNVLPGRYLLLSRGGPFASVRIEEPSAKVELGTAELRIRARAGRKLAIAPAGAEPIAVLMCERVDARRVPGSGQLVFAPLVPGRYAILEDRGGAAAGGRELMQIELTAEGLDIEID